MGTCESCGRTDEVTEKVQRIYLSPTEAEAEAGAEAPGVPGDIEQWCASCRATFPHVVITAE